MTIPEQSASSVDCWQLDALPGEGLIAAGSHHVLIVEVDDAITDSGVADKILNAYDAHSRLLGRGAARSMRLAISTVLADHEKMGCAVALVSAWDDKIGVYLQGNATATFHHADQTITLTGNDSVVATDVVLPNDFDQLELGVGAHPDDRRVPLDIGAITTGTGVRVMWPGQHEVVRRLNSW
jgi:hypothetical protein